MSYKETLGSYDGTEVHVTWRDEDEDLTPEQALMRKRVLHQVETQPKTFDMDDYETNVRITYDDEHPEGVEETVLFEEVNVCDTTRCIAGWAEYFARLDGHKPDYITGSARYAAHAIESLGLTKGEYFSEPPERKDKDMRFLEEISALFHDGNDEALARLRKLASE